MRIVVPLKAVPDLVEEIELTDDGTDIDREFLKFVLNEWDDQALEEALLIKDAGGAEVVAVALADDPDIDQALYTALAKGADAGGQADRRGRRRHPADTHARAAAFAAYLRGEPGRPGDHRRAGAGRPRRPAAAGARRAPGPAARLGGRLGRGRPATGAASGRSSPAAGPPTWRSACPPSSGCRRPGRRRATRRSAGSARRCRPAG